MSRWKLPLRRSRPACHYQPPGCRNLPHGNVCRFPTRSNRPSRSPIQSTYSRNTRPCADSKNAKKARQFPAGLPLFRFKNRRSYLLHFSQLLQPDSQHSAHPQQQSWQGFPAACEVETNNAGTARAAAAKINNVFFIIQFSLNKVLFFYRITCVVSGKKRGPATNTRRA